MRAPRARGFGAPASARVVFGAQPRLGMDQLKEGWTRIQRFLGQKVPAAD